MGKKDKRIDAFIKASPDFARPVLIHLREVVHINCPEVTETIKWRFASFEYHGLLCSMAAFKNHCSFGFWKASLMSDPALKAMNSDAAGNMGKIMSLKDLPSDRKLAGYIKEAMKLNENGVKVMRKPVDKKDLVVPADLRKALNGSKAMKNNFEEFSPSKKKDYIDWLEEAKTDDTRNKRLLTAMEWIADGKSRNWKYERR